MKVYIIISLAALSSIKASPADNKRNLTFAATVIFYCDLNGDKLVAAGKVNKAIEDIIREYIQTNIKDVPVEVMPIYEEISEVPPVEELNKLIDDKYKQFYVTYVPLRVILKVLEEKLPKFKPKYLSDLKHLRLNSFAKDVGNLIQETSAYYGNKAQMEKRFFVGPYSSLILQYILIHLEAILSCLSITLAENTETKTNLTVTVLFYCNNKGNKIVAAGHVAMKVESIIKKSLQNMLNYAHIEIEPAYKDVNDVPPIETASDLMTQKHKLVFVENVPKIVISKIVAHKMRMIANRTSHVKHYDMSNYTKSVTSLTKAVLNKNLDSLPKKFNIAPMIIHSFIPNSVCFAVSLTRDPVLHKYSNFKGILFKMSNAWKKIKSFLS
ncbi:hypothetical protein HW555_004260 [Spodoptera exigua]|uniref:Uncharacterized protein n=1 Tax=Spodoptera exigua TaxID=7107 RepID=A0A835GKK0_SPOEX|nr:hypothetical protein HW555_004260 [Spodoptera exigua]